MHPIQCLFDDLDQAIEKDGLFWKRFPQSEWENWGSELGGYKSETHLCAYISDNSDDFGLALIFEKVGEHPNRELSMRGAIPVICQGIPKEVELVQHSTNEEVPATGILSLLTDRRTSIVVSDPDYVEHHHLLREGAHYFVHLCGWASCIKPQMKSFEITEGPAVERERARREQEDDNFAPDEQIKLAFSMENLRSLSTQDEPIWHEFTTKIEKLKETHFGGRRGWLFEGDVEKSDENDTPPLRIAFAVMGHVMEGYLPKEGDLISGSVYLQALVKNEVPFDDKPWLDQPSDADFMWENILAMMNAGKQFSGASHEVRLTAQLLAQGGWEVTSPSSWDGALELHPLLLQVQRGDDTHLIGLAINDVPAPKCDLVLKVSCVRQGDGHQVKLCVNDPAVKTLSLAGLELWAKDDQTPAKIE